MSAEILFGMTLIRTVFPSIELSVWKSSFFNILGNGTISFKSVADALPHQENRISIATPSSYASHALQIRPTEPQHSSPHSNNWFTNPAE